MKILILGAGQVGTTAAYSLAREEANEVTIVDRNPEVLRELQDRLDVRTVVGHAAHPEVLERAGAADAHMIIALTNSDEINMTAWQVAYTLFKTPRRIARIRASVISPTRSSAFSAMLFLLGGITGVRFLAGTSRYRLAWLRRRCYLDVALVRVVKCLILFV